MLSYIGRHWRGELSLAVTYWADGFLPTIALTFASRMLTKADMGRAPRLFAIANVILLVIWVAIAVWQIVGVWRSASRSIQVNTYRGQTNIWAHLAGIATTINSILLISNSINYTIPAVVTYAKIVADQKMVVDPHHVRVLNHGAEIEISGGIDFGTSAEFEQLLNVNPGVRTVDLNSSGGWLLEAGHIRDLILARHLATYTDALCLSACTIIYIAGNPRYIGPDGHLGFHRGSFPGFPQSSDDIVNAQSKAELIAAGISRDFLDKAFAVDGSDMWLPDRSELRNAHVITDEADGLNFAAVSVSAVSDAASFDKFLLNLSAFVALKREDPTSYQRIIAQAVASVQIGDTPNEIDLRARDALVDEAKTLAVFASDNVEIEIAKLTADEARAMAPGHPDKCMVMLHRTEPNQAYVLSLPVPLIQRELTLMGKVITSGAAHPSVTTDDELTGASEARRVWETVRSRGIDISSVVGAQISPTEQRTACLAHAEFMDAVAGLPPSRSGALMRFLLKSPDRLFVPAR